MQCIRSSGSATNWRWPGSAIPHTGPRLAPRQKRARSSRGQADHICLLPLPSFTGEGGVRAALPLESISGRQSHPHPGLSPARGRGRRSLCNRSIIGRGGAILIPGAAPHRPRKRWPAERFGELATPVGVPWPGYDRRFRRRRTPRRHHPPPMPASHRPHRPHNPPATRPNHRPPPASPSATTPAPPTLPPLSACPRSRCSPTTVTRRSPVPAAM